MRTMLKVVLSLLATLVAAEAALVGVVETTAAVRRMANGLLALSSWRSGCISRRSTWPSPVRQAFCSHL